MFSIPDTPGRLGRLAGLRILAVFHGAGVRRMQELDARGLQCPLPLLKARQLLNRLPVGECLRILATDAGSLRDFRVFCEQSGNRLESQVSENGVHTHVIRKVVG